MNRAVKFFLLLTLMMQSMCLSGFVPLLREILYGVTTMLSRSSCVSPVMPVCFSMVSLYSSHISSTTSSQ